MVICSFWTTRIGCFLYQNITIPIFGDQNLQVVILF